jgi:hypothetical protein
VDGKKEQTKPIMLLAVLRSCSSASTLGEPLLLNPVYYDVQPDDRIRYWGFIIELGCYLPVVTLFNHHS